ncbi:MAG: LysR family transcriptional regulator [Roseivivax sp.]|nr:LysR family transcriptional regulator [Roseivivax sp.]
MHNANWDDLRFVLAVAEAGSVAAAARDLGVNHATVLRRIAAWEEANGAEVFERSAHGYRLRPERAAVIEAARSAAQAMETVSRLVAGQGAGRQEMLRVTSVDTLCHTILAPGLKDWSRAAAPAHVALLCSNTRLDMARLHADLCVRPADSLSEDMTGTEVCQMGFAGYAAPGAAACWLAPTGALGRSAPARWMAATVEPAQIAAGADSFVVLRAMAEAGAGRTILPCILGDAAPGLVRIETDVPPMAVPLWVACHRDLADAPRLSALRRALVALLARHRIALEG